MRESIRLGRIAGIPVGLNISVFVIMLILVFGLAFGRFPVELPNRSIGEYLAAAVVASGPLDGPARSDERRTDDVPIRDGSAAVPPRPAAGAPPRRPMGVRIVPPPVRGAHAETVG